MVPEVGAENDGVSKKILEGDKVMRCRISAKQTVTLEPVREHIRIGVPSGWREKTQTATYQTRQRSRVSRYSSQSQQSGTQRRLALAGSTKTSCDTALVAESLSRVQLSTRADIFGIPKMEMHTSRISGNSVMQSPK